MVQRHEREIRCLMSEMRVVLRHPDFAELLRRMERLEGRMADAKHPPVRSQEWNEGCAVEGARIVFAADGVEYHWDAAMELWVRFPYGGSE
jgi:hypothetical protein